MTMDADAPGGATLCSVDGLRAESSTPGAGVLVISISGSLDHGARQLVERYVEHHLLGKPSVLVLDLSRVTAFGAGGSDVLTATCRRTRKCRVPLELVVSSYAVAKSVQLSDPDLLRRAWPSLSQALATVCGPATDDCTTDGTGESEGMI